MKRNIAQRRAACVLTPVTLACALAACGGDGGGSSSLNNTTYTGKVTASAFKADASGDPTLTAGYYSGATVFLDANGNGVKDSNEPSTTTDATGKFVLAVPAGTTGQIVAESRRPRPTRPAAPRSRPT
jgi:hypothetical protein